VLYDSAGGSFETTVLAFGIDGYPRIEADADGFLHIVYYEYPARQLHYLTDASGHWTTESIDEMPQWKDTSIFDLTLDATGRPHVLFTRFDTHFDLGGVLAWAVRADTGGWNIENVHQYPYGQSAQRAIIRIDRNSNTRMVVHDRSNDSEPTISTFRQVGGEWKRERIFADWDLDAWMLELAIDRYGFTHVAARLSMGIDKAYIHLSDESGEWSVETLPNPYDRWLVGFWIEGGVRPVILGYDQSPYLTKFVRAGGVWQSEPLFVGGPISAIRSGDVGLRFVQFDDYGHIQFGSWNGVDLSTETLDDAGHVGMATSMAVDPDGNAYVFYREIEPYASCVADNVGGDWRKSTLFDAPYASGVNGPASIAIGADGLVRGLFRDSAAYDQVVTYFEGREDLWTVQDIGYPDPLVWSIDVALDSADRLHACVCDDSYESTRHVTSNGGIWTSEPIDPLIGHRHDTCRIAIDAADAAHVAFEYLIWEEYFPPTYVFGWHAIRYVEYDTGAWPSIWETAWFTPNLGGFELDNTGGAWIVLHSLGKLQIATNATGAWRRRTIDPAFSGKPAAFTLDDAGTAHIAYGVRGDLDFVVYANNATGEWRRWAIDAGSWWSGVTGVDLTVDEAGYVHVSYTLQQTAYYAQFPAP
ncbi:MAG: hypothetical protein KJ042_00815, partial [Deltaproteobacteria bacterium]|nr:hypothetical protein [Deltaproteobacteria bacterium]